MILSSDMGRAEGVRARKHRETLARITDAGICLFLERGYDATTIDDVAAAAGISRRTFFHYFKSKDDILVSLQSGMGDMIADAIRNAPAQKRPLEVMRDAVLEVCEAIPPDELRAIDRLMHSSAAVQARKQASYVEQENILFSALRERWPDPAREGALRLIAMLSIGAIRLATQAFGQEGEVRALTDLLRDAFETLRSEL